jgi:uncharacterized cupin superfamily protein
MPTIITPEEHRFGYGPFNKPPFGLLTLLPNLGKQAGAKNLVFDIRMLPAGAYSFPYHYHRNAEEVMYIVDGSMTLRTNEGIRPVSKGDVLHFETGESGAHQFFNHTAEPCRYFDVKTLSGIDVVVYPDSGKVMISQYNEVYDMAKQVGYFEGEEGVAERWRKGFPAKTGTP